MTNVDPNDDRRTFYSACNGCKHYHESRSRCYLDGERIFHVKKDRVICDSKVTKSVSTCHKCSCNNTCSQAWSSESMGGICGAELAGTGAPNFIKETEPSS